MTYSSVIIPKTGKISVSRTTNLGIADYDLNELYSPDTGFWRSKVLDLASPKYSPNKSYIFDKSPYNNHGAISGATWIRLPSGLWCLSFDKIDDNVQCGSDTSLDNLTAFTFLTWIYPKSAGEGDLGRIIGKGNLKRLSLNATLNLRAEIIATVANGDSVTNETVTANTWQLVSAIWDSAGDNKLYTTINGVASTYSTQIAVNTPIDDNADNLWIGSDTAGNRVWDGYIALSRVLNVTKTTAWIKGTIFDRERHLFGV